jgi:broad specificity phosphatase PhoE
VAENSEGGERPHEIDFVTETFDALGERMARALEALATRHAGGEVAVVSHGDPIKAAVCRFTGVPIARMHDVRVPTGSILGLEIDGGEARIVDRWAPERGR